MTSELETPQTPKTAKTKRNARATRAPKPTTPDQTALATTIAVEVAKALATIADVQRAQAVKDPKDMSPEELKAEHERLQTALEALPYVGEQVTGALKPGTIIGEGLTREYVPHTREWFIDVEARRQDRNTHNGKPAELTWPNYGMHTVFYQGVRPWLDIKINGVCFTVLPGIECQLPTPFYTQYMESIRGGQVNDRRFAEPSQPGTKAGYMHVNPENGLAVILGKGALPSMAEREAQDRPA